MSSWWWNDDKKKPQQPGAKDGTKVDAQTPTEEPGRALDSTDKARPRRETSRETGTAVSASSQAEASEAAAKEAGDHSATTAKPGSTASKSFTSSSASSGSSTTSTPSGSSGSSGSSSSSGSSGSSSSNSNTIAPVLELQGAPRQPNVLALPLDRRPLFPGLMHPIQISDRTVYEALVRTRASGNPYIGLFLRKHDITARDMVEDAPSDRILSLSEVHPVGTFAQIVQMEPLQNLLTAGTATNDNQGHGFEEAAEAEFHNPEEQMKKQELRDSLFKADKRDQPQRDGDFARAGSVSQPTEGSWTILVKAHRRIQIEELVNMGPPPLVKVSHISELPLKNYNSDTIRAYTNEVVVTLRDVIRHNPLLREHLAFFSTRFDMSDPHHVCNFAASLTSADAQDLQEVLEAFNLENRLKKVLTLLKKEVQLNALQEEISKQVEETISANQRKYFLNEQLKQIKKELGLEHDDKDALMQKYQEKLDALQGIGVPQTGTGASEDEDEDEDYVDEQPAGQATDGDSASGNARQPKPKTYIQGELAPEVKKVMEDELKKLSTLEKTSPEFNVTRAYLDWLFSLPWGKCTEENLDVKHAKGILEKEHFGLNDIKERILEFIAVGNLRGTVQGKIVLLVGPPGVGKTSIGISIAHALDREFYRFSVGGLSDVSEIKGHRRTYIGAMPGKLIQCLKTTGVSNPVVLIDEIDKLGTGHRGDPASALLELLDPAQNNAFLDHYIDVPVDLSKVLFVCTANSTDTIPGPLLDRMEVLRLSGYDLPEKVEIAKRYLEPRAKKDCGLLSDPKEVSEDSPALAADPSRPPSEASHPVKLPPSRRRTTLDHIPASLGLDEPAIAALARWYCREAGVRKLEQHIERIYRKISLELLTSEPADLREKDWKITEDKLEKYVGKPRFQSDKLFDSVPPPGVVMGLAWSTVGGSALYIETTKVRRPVDTASHRESKDQDSAARKSPGGGGHSFSVHTTGQLGDVMKESTSLALTCAKHELQNLDPGNDFFESNQIHLHVPEGATPKDGPSAGVTMTTALLSLALNKSVRPDLAMTGEISLTGMVLPVGGIKEKVIAARRSGVTTIILPDGNRKDADELPDYLKDGLSIHFAKRYQDVYNAAFDSPNE